MRRILRTILPSTGQRDTDMQGDGMLKLDPQASSGNWGDCQQPISPNKARAICANCHHHLHLNESCSGLKAQSWKCKGASVQASWVCPRCRQAAGVSGDTRSAENGTRDSSCGSAGSSSSARNRHKRRRGDESPADPTENAMMISCHVNFSIQKVHFRELLK